MRRADQVSGLVLLACGLAFAAGARQYPYTAPTGPGSGFLPLWLGLAMAGLAAALLVRATRTADPGPSPWPDRRGLTRLAAVVGATAAFVALMDVVGMVLGTALFLVALLRFLGGHSWPLALAVAAGTASFNWLVFAHWLHVPFPAGVLGF